MAKAGRKRKQGALRDSAGISRDSEIARKLAFECSIARQAAELRRAGIPETHAGNQLAGFTLGKLRLRGPNDPGGISEEQYQAGNAWAILVHRHAAIMGYRLSIATPSFSSVIGGSSCAKEPGDDEVLAVRRRWSDAYNALVSASRDHGLRVRDVTYGVAVENWPLERLSEADYGLLRVGLNVIGKALR
jgi:hypothetical protein